MDSRLVSLFAEHYEPLYLHLQSVEIPLYYFTRQHSHVYKCIRYLRRKLHRKASIRMSQRAMKRERSRSLGLGEGPQPSTTDEEVMEIIHRYVE